VRVYPDPASRIALYQHFPPSGTKATSFEELRQLPALKSELRNSVVHHGFSNSNITNDLSDD
jgi:hypothetical protein